RFSGSGTRSSNPAPSSGKSCKPSVPKAMEGSTFRTGFRTPPRVIHGVAAPSEDPNVAAGQQKPTLRLGSEVSGYPDKAARSTDIVIQAIGKQQLFPSVLPVDEANHTKSPDPPAETTISGVFTQPRWIADLRRSDGQRRGCPGPCRSPATARTAVVRPESRRSRMRAADIDTGPRFLT